MRETKAQDKFTGTWLCNANAYKIEWRIGSPDHGTAYPSVFYISTDSFAAAYYCLLAKRDAFQLFIGRNKQPSFENPFSIVPLTNHLTGILSYRVEKYGIAHLALQRFICMDCPVKISWNPIDVTPNNKQIATNLEQIFINEPLDFIKQNSEPATDTGFYKLMQPGLVDVNFGILKDTLYIPDRQASVFPHLNKDNDIISVTINNKILLDGIDTKKKQGEETFFLDIGTNLICLFADDYGKKNNATASINLRSERQTKTISFKDSSQHNATFIIQRVICTNKGNDPWQIDPKKYAGIQWDDNMKDKKTKPTNQSIPEQSQVIGEVNTQSKELTFAIWDDALEDGDSISLQINGEWLTRGFSVKKAPQYLTVRLAPGPNIITFIADNLGSISPNTSVLEIIDAGRRKTFHIETDKKLNNQVRIYYDIN